MAGETWNSAKADTLKTCGPEVDRGDYTQDVNGAFNGAQRAIEKSTGMLESKGGRLDKNGAKIQTALREGGKNACGQIMDALSSASVRGEITMAAAKPVEAPKATEQKSGGYDIRTAAYNTFANRGKQIDDAVN